MQKKKLLDWKLKFEKKKKYPNPAFWRIAAEEGCRVVLGCDAHRPEDAWLPTLEKKATELLASCGFREITQVMEIGKHFYPS